MSDMSAEKVREDVRVALSEIQSEIDYLESVERTEFGDGHLCGLRKGKEAIIWTVFGRTPRNLSTKSAPAAFDAAKESAK